MKSIFLLIALLTVFISCNNKSNLKEYYYLQIESDNILEDLNLKGERKFDTIYATNDSIAYFEAFKKFHIAKAIHSKPEFVSLPEPIDFKVYNEDQLEIFEALFYQPNDSVLNNMKISISKSTHTDLNDLKLDNSLSAKVDHKLIKKLISNFRIKSDEFDPSGSVWYIPKRAPKFVNYDGIHFYFQVNDSLASNFRFRLQYKADDWLFINKVQFLIDGNAYEFIPKDVKRDNGTGSIWEWFDEEVRYNDWALIEALANAKSAKMKIIGTNYHDIKNISYKELEDFSNTLKLYKAFGGREF